MMRPAFLAALALAATAACDRTPGHVGPGSDILMLDVDPEPIDKLDILFVIDNSGSMEGQQDALVAAAREQLFGQLTDALGALPDLHLGVTSTSAPLPPGSLLGTTCRNDAWNQGGTLTINACPGITGSYLVDEDDGAGGRTRNYEGDLADAFTCMGRLGTSGCGFEQPLEAMARALDRTQPGHAGFLRDDALLLVVFVTDEDDCSTRDGAFYGDPEATLMSALGPKVSFRCFDFAVTCAEDNRTVGAKTDCTLRDDSYLTPIDDLVFRLRAVKPDPTRIMVAGIHGTADDVEVIVDPIVGSSWAPVLMLQNQCLGTDVEVAPALRLAAFGAEFPSRWVLAADCAQSTAAKVQRITRATAGVLARTTCLLGPTPDLDTCEATSVSPTGARTTLRRCTGGATNDCYLLGVDPIGCSYTEHQLRAVVPSQLVPPGDRLQVHCTAR